MVLGQNAFFHHLGLCEPIAECATFTFEISHVSGEIRDFGGEIMDFGGEIRDFGGEIRDFGGEIRDFGDEAAQSTHVCQQNCPYMATSWAGSGALDWLTADM